MREAIGVMASVLVGITAFVVLFGGLKVPDHLIGFVALLALSNAYRADAELAAYKRGR